MESIENGFNSKKPKTPKDKKTIISLIIFIVGIIALVVGVVFLVLKLNQGPAVADGEYLVSKGKWTLENETNCEATKTENEEEAEGEKNAEETNCTSGVIWNFTEIGKGTLTTNNHTNDYDFVWALEDGKFKIETKWLYDLNNEYEYTLDQNKGLLTLTNDDETIVFRASLDNK